MWTSLILNLAIPFGWALLLTNFNGIELPSNGYKMLCIWIGIVYKSATISHFFFDEDHTRFIKNWGNTFSNLPLFLFSKPFWCMDFHFLCDQFWKQIKYRYSFARIKCSEFCQQFVIQFLNCIQYSNYEIKKATDMIFGYCENCGTL